MILRSLTKHVKDQNWFAVGRHPVRCAAIYRCAADTRSPSVERLLRTIPDQHCVTTRRKASGMTVMVRFRWKGATP
jgi:hypothetical protein